MALVRWRVCIFALLSLLLMAIDTRFKYLPEIRQTIAVAIYPLQRLAHVRQRSTISERIFINRDLIDEIAYLRNSTLLIRAASAAAGIGG